MGGRREEDTREHYNVAENATEDHKTFRTTIAELETKSMIKTKTEHNSRQTAYIEQKSEPGFAIK